MMLRGLSKLIWIEMKVFMREPLGAMGTVLFPVLIFMVLRRITYHRVGPSSIPGGGLSGAGIPVFVSLLIVISAVLSMVTIISIYRESGILKRLRATPLRPYTILAAHVIVKLMLTAATLILMVLAGRHYFPPGAHVPWLSFTAALMISTCSILSVGFIIASIVPTARFAQPIGALILYPMIAISGLFVPLSVLPPALNTVARALPLTYAVSLLKGIWNGEGWSTHTSDVAAMVIFFILCTALSSRIFRWE
ncbi:ABC transporter permease [Telmatobacter sp. DSM 110680]|uniref:Transport permease protein n=1 Tax=Telmatobacter sp. DSM 110680 TaxID=3036704 RepID=A0AAU7DG86_9BACT